MQLSHLLFILLANLSSILKNSASDLQIFNKGSTLFAQVGCASCHTPKQKTGNSIRFPLLSQQIIYPYTDLLLHDMGPGLDDGVKEKNAESNE